MKHELEHFYIDNSYGGNQDWFPTFMMHIGGCGAETACDSSVYFALHRGLTDIAPENAEGMTRRDYVRFAYKMKPYLSPRRTGIDRLIHGRLCAVSAGLRRNAPQHDAL